MTCLHMTVTWPTRREVSSRDEYHMSKAQSCSAAAVSAASEVSSRLCAACCSASIAVIGTVPTHRWRP
jgi:hypothetical protein